MAYSVIRDTPLAALAATFPPEPAMQAPGRQLRRWKK